MLRMLADGSRCFASRWLHLAASQLGGCARFARDASAASRLTWFLLDRDASHLDGLSKPAYGWFTWARFARDMVDFKVSRLEILPNGPRFRPFVEVWRDPLGFETL